MPTEARYTVISANRSQRLFLRLRRSRVVAFIPTFAQYPSPPTPLTWADEEPRAVHSVYAAIELVVHHSARRVAYRDLRQLR